MASSVCQPTDVSLLEWFVQHFQATFARTDAIFDGLSPDAYRMRPIPLRHPFVFYEGHLAAFIGNTLFRATLNDLQGRSPEWNEWDTRFARGIDPHDVTSKEARANRDDWPARERLLAYRDATREALFELLRSYPLQPGGPVVSSLHMVLEHEWMHQETLLYMAHQLPVAMKRDWVAALAGRGRNAEPGSVADNGLGMSGFAASSSSHLVSCLAGQDDAMQALPAGTVLLGARPDEFNFTWDNERPAFFQPVSAFWMDRYSVTNGQFLAFVDAGGYHNPSWWTASTWQWRLSEQVTHPHYWTWQDGQWQLRDFEQDRPLPLNWPVFVTHAEAMAYAAWVGKDLPTEAEWHWAAYGEQQTQRYPWGMQTPWASTQAVGFGAGLSPHPVGADLRAVSPWGIYDLWSNGWEWTRSVWMPWPGFQASSVYPGYSADFFDGEHFVLKGGSQFTDAHLLRRSFRNWFYGHYPYMYAKFRCVSRQQTEQRHQG